MGSREIMVIIPVILCAVGFGWVMLYYPLVKGKGHPKKKEEKE